MSFTSSSVTATKLIFPELLICATEMNNNFYDDGLKALTVPMIDWLSMPQTL